VAGTSKESSPTKQPHYFLLQIIKHLAVSKYECKDLQLQRGPAWQRVQSGVPLRIRTSTRAAQNSELQGRTRVPPLKEQKQKTKTVDYKSRKVKYRGAAPQILSCKVIFGVRSTDPVATTKGNQPTTRLVGATSFVVSPSSASVSAAALRKNSSRTAMALLARRTMTKPAATATIQ